MILLVSNSLSGGGAEIVAREHRNKLLQADYDVRVASSEPGSECQLLACKANIFSAIFGFRNFIRLLRYLFATKPKIVHCHNFLPELSPSVLLALNIYKKFRPVFICQTLHDFHPACPNSSLYRDSENTTCRACIGASKFQVVRKKCFRDSLPGSVFKYVRYMIFRYVLGHRKVVDLFLCPSEFMREVMMADGISSDRLIFLQNPLSFSHVSSFDPKMNGEGILYMGRLSKEKGVALLLEAAAKANIERPIYICGDGPEREKLEQYSRELNLRTVEFLGFLSKPELQAVARKCSVLVLPSIWFENAPMVLYEALSLGLVPVCSDVGGMREFVERHAIGRMFTTGSSDHLASVLTELLKPDAMADEQVKIARYWEASIDQSGEDRYLSQILSLYRSHSQVVA